LPVYLVTYPPDVLLMIWPGDPSQAKLIPQETSSFVVYEMVDDYDAIPHTDEVWHRTHREWMHKADVLSATADTLLAQLASCTPGHLAAAQWRAGRGLEGAPPPQVPEDMIAASGSCARWVSWRTFALV